jgi:hypothetical protein
MHHWERIDRYISEQSDDLKTISNYNTSLLFLIRNTTMWALGQNDGTRCQWAIEPDWFQHQARCWARGQNVKPDCLPFLWMPRDTSASSTGTTLTMHRQRTKNRILYARNGIGGINETPQTSRSDTVTNIEFCLYQPILKLLSCFSKMSGINTKCIGSHWS